MLDHNIHKEKMQDTSKLLFLKGLLILVFLLSNTKILAQDKYGGLALYTVRDEMAMDAKSTLKKVAEMGYAYIEAAGYEKGLFYGMTPQEFKSYLKSIDLKPVSTQQIGVTLDNLDREIAHVKEAGFEYFSIPVPPMGMLVYDSKSKTTSLNCSLAELVETLTVIGKRCNKAGLKFLYHNHDFEFKKGKEGVKPIDYLLEHTDPRYVNFEMDLYWVKKAGVDPVTYLESYPNRFKLWHVKDMDKEGDFAPIGTGTMNLKRIAGRKEVSGMEKYFVEQDETGGQKPMEAIKISHENLRQIGFK